VKFPIVRAIVEPAGVTAATNPAVAITENAIASRLRVNRRGRFRNSGASPAGKEAAPFK
jgi:hypothetical protein